MSKSAPTIKCVIFDLDGTLMNAYPAVYASVNATLKEFAYPKVSHGTIKRTVGWGDRHLIGTFVEPSDLDRALMFYRRHHAKALKKDTKLLPGAERLLKDLKVRGFKLAVASNRPQKFSLIAINFLGIRKYFDVILCGDRVARAKPAPDLLKAILKKLSLRPSQAVYVGDMGIDILTGRRARVTTIAVATGSNTAVELKAMRPRAVVKSLAGVRDFLL